MHRAATVALGAVLAGGIVLAHAFVAPTEARAATNKQIVVACVKSFPRNREGCKCLTRYTPRLKPAGRTYLLRSLRKGTSVGVRYRGRINTFGIASLVDQVKRGAKC